MGISDRWEQRQESEYAGLKKQNACDFVKLSKPDSTHQTPLNIKGAEKKTELIKTLLVMQISFASLFSFGRIKILWFYAAVLEEKVKPRGGGLPLKQESSLSFTTIREISSEFGQEKSANKLRRKTQVLL